LIKDADHEDPSFLGRLQWLHISRRDWRRLRISAAWEILSSAGTYGDVSRHLQVLPGVVGVSDLSDGVLGAHPRVHRELYSGYPQTHGCNRLQGLGFFPGFLAPIIGRSKVRKVE
jgi:hypothetical protein